MGIGREYARALGEAGAAVVLADLNAQGVEAAAAELREQGLRAAAVEVDVTSEASAQAMAARAVSELGGIDILVNNAALMAEAPQLSCSSTRRMVEPHPRRQPDRGADLQPRRACPR